MSGEERVLSRWARFSIALNKARGCKYPHLTLSGELWLTNSRLHKVVDVAFFLTIRERDHCRKQYIAYGTVDQRKVP